MPTQSSKGYTDAVVEVLILYMDRDLKLIRYSLKIIADVTKKKFQTIPPQFHHNSALPWPGMARYAQIQLPEHRRLAQNHLVAPGGRLKNASRGVRLPSQREFPFSPTSILCYSKWPCNYCRREWKILIPRGFHTLRRPPGATTRT